MYQLKRHGGPILTPDKDLAWEREGVFNPGIIKREEDIVMLYRAIGERNNYISRIGLATSTDGVSFKRGAVEPVIGPSEIYDKWATEDPRITAIDGEYFITYVGVPDPIMENGQPIVRSLPLETSSALLKTSDFVTFEKLGIISPSGSDNKDVVLFPEKINGRFAMLHRPTRWAKSWFNGSFDKFVDEGLPCPVSELPDIPGIWIAFSDNLTNWNDHRLVMKPTHHLDAKIGAGLPPIKTSEGWLLIYHHVDQGTEPNTFRYSVRAAMLDLNEPSKFISKIPYDILAPEEPYEKESSSGIVFPSGGYVEGDMLKVYYGASDNSVCLATGSLRELILELKHFTI